MAIPITAPAIHAPHRHALEDAAAHYARLDPVEAEAVIDALVSGAIAAWRLEDATYWQRVKFRARMIRKMRPNETISDGSEAFSLRSAGKMDDSHDHSA